MKHISAQSRIAPLWTVLVVFLVLLLGSGGGGGR